MTNDLGTDAGSTSMNIVAKALELLLKLLDKIYDAWRSAPERQAKLYEVKNAKTAGERKEAIKKIDSRTGKVNHDLLVKSGKPRTMCGIHMTKDEIKDFNSICRRQGIIFSAVSNVQMKKNNEKAFLGIECLTADLEKMKEAVEIFNAEKRQKAIDSRIEEILSKGRENLTEQDYANLRELSGQKEQMQRTYCDTVNRDMSDAVINNIYHDEKLKPMDIEEAINRITGRSLDKDQHTIVADAENPDKFIACHGHNDVDSEGKIYIKTEYEVYQGKELKLKTDDGRFEGRPANYWETQRNRIANAVDFSGTFYKFINREDYEKWAAHVKEKNAEIGAPEIQSPENGSMSRNYVEIKKSLEEQLNRNGMEIKDSTLCNKESGVPLWYMDIYHKDMMDKITPEDKIRVAESIVIAKQIENCEEIYNLRNELTIAESELLIAPRGTAEYDVALKNKGDLEERLGNLMEKEKGLWNERKDINAAKAQQEVDNERETDMEYGYEQEEHELGQSNSRERNAGQDKDKTTDKDRTTMEEVHKDIMGEKAKDSEKTLNPAEVLTDRAKPQVTKENR